MQADRRSHLVAHEGGELWSDLALAQVLQANVALCDQGARGVDSSLLAASLELRQQRHDAVGCREGNHRAARLQDRGSLHLYRRSHAAE
jgi:hypothetical protein